MVQYMVQYMVQHMVKYPVHRPVYQYIRQYISWNASFIIRMFSEAEVILEDHLVEICGVSDAIGTVFNGPLIVHTEIRYSTVESILTGEVFLRAHLYEWYYDTIQDSGIWALNFHEVL